MTTMRAKKKVREGDAEKRATILAAARELFLRNGAARTSMDAVSAEAGVSKRTVYDYYGDKQGLMLGIIENAGEAVLASLYRALDAHVSDSAEIGTTAQLEDALVDLFIEINESIVVSIDYAALFRLIEENRGALPDLSEHPLATEPEEAMTERVAHFADLGLLCTDDPRLATDHLLALTTLRAYTQSGDREKLDIERTRRIMRDGVHAFMRAYAVREP